MKVKKTQCGNGDSEGMQTGGLLCGVTPHVECFTFHILPVLQAHLCFSLCAVMERNLGTGGMSQLAKCSNCVLSRAVVLCLPMAGPGCGSVND
jgi:hypothetical protein